MTTGSAVGARSWGASRLSLSYGSRLALDQVSVAIPAGEVTAVVGGDGAGKTSLLRCLAGALRPTAGTVHVPGKARIGYLSAGSGTYPDLTVAENLAFRAGAYGVPAGALAARAGELLDRAGLTGARDRLAGQLSGGMRQKLGVIAALLPGPELLILDEPSTGVDPVSRSGLWWLIASAAAAGTAVILSTTYLDDAQRASSVLVLDAGTTIAAGSPDRIVAGMPGALSALSKPPAGPAARRAWRRGTGWRLWTPPGSIGPPAGTIAPDLQDAITVAVLAREVATAGEAGRPAGAEQPRPDRPAGAEQPCPDRPAAAQPPRFASAQAARPGLLAEAREVTCRFGDVLAVHDVSLTVAPGEIVGLLGANGAGKTTLIRLLLGLISADSGVVELLGEPPSRGTRRRIGYVPQGLGLYDDLSPAENMAFAAAVFDSGQARSSRRSWPGPQSGIGDDGAVSDDSAIKEPVGSLPLGVQRRVAFSQALAHRPDLLILDEPTSGVDPLGRARLWQTISGAVRSGAGALVSTHYMEEAGECDRLIVMADGAVVATGTEAEIIGGMTVPVVQAANWADAFARLEKAGLPVALAGRTLRVPGASDAEVAHALPAGAAVRREPATLEERFFDLVLRPGAAATA